jgi:aspartyl-tRNA(Asn)/glutamyl-tRNA(Gln) amidotransferase subunit A
MTVSEFASRWRAGEVSSVEVTEGCLARIGEVDSSLNAFILVLADEARRQAELADRERAAGDDRGPLHGVPISVKDLFDVAGTPTTAGSRVRDGHLAQADAAAVARLRQAGAVIIGKTNLHEFAMGPTNEDSAFGPTLNPHDRTRLAGGSSGGSAVSVATGMALATLGTDTGGSIRIPAAACGIVGLKPTYEELSCDGVVPLSRTLDHIGPLTSTVTDAWLVFHALRGPIPTLPLETAPVSGRRYAVPRRYFCDLLDDEVREAFEGSLGRLKSGGAEVDDVDVTLARFISSVYLQIVFGDAAAYHASTLEEMPERYTSAVRIRLEAARYVLAEDYVRALAGREALRREVDHVLSGYDALILPTIPIAAPRLGEPTVPLGGRPEPVRNVLLRLTQLFNLTGHPAISIPNGRTSEGLPTGLQLVGTCMQTDSLLHTARAVEAAIA